MKPSQLQTKNALGGDYSRENVEAVTALVLKMLDFADIDEDLRLTINAKTHLVRGQNLHGKVSIGKLSRSGRNFEIHCQPGRNGTQVCCTIQKAKGKAKPLRTKIISSFGGGVVFDSKTMKKKKVAIRKPVSSSEEIQSSDEQDTGDDPKSKISVRKPVSSSEEVQSSDDRRDDFGRGYFKKPENLNWLLDLIAKKTGEEPFVAKDLQLWITQETGKTPATVGLAKTMSGLVRGGFLIHHNKEIKPIEYALPNSKTKEHKRVIEPVVSESTENVGSLKSSFPIPRSDVDSFRILEVKADIYELVGIIDEAFRRIGDSSQKLPEFRGSDSPNLPPEVYLRVKEDPSFKESFDLIKRAREITTAKS